MKHKNNSLNGLKKNGYFIIAAYAFYLILNLLLLLFGRPFDGLGKHFYFLIFSGILYFALFSELKIEVVIIWLLVFFVVYGSLVHFGEAYQWDMHYLVGSKYSRSYVGTLEFFTIMWRCFKKKTTPVIDIFVVIFLITLSVILI